MGEAIFFLLSQRHKLDEAGKKVAYCSFFLISLSQVSTMHEVVGKAILPNTFSKTAQLHLESHS